MTYVFLIFFIKKVGTNDKLKNAVKKIRQGSVVTHTMKANLIKPSMPEPLDDDD